MAIINITESKTLQKYCQKLGREGVALRIIEIAKEIVEGNGAYQSTIKNAGKIKALAIGCKFDSYWEEKAIIGYNSMVEEANYQVRKKEDGNKKD